jgi:glycosyltransferase involved in cell wall biosynthesis
MTILHIGFGFRPWRPGGLITYAEDLMEAQAARGDRVAYFFAGRHYPGLRRPRLHRWRRRGVQMLEVLNSPITVAFDLGTRRPRAEVSEPHTEDLFRRALASVRPDVLHIQELNGLPSSVIDIADAAGVPMVFTLQDYFALCPTNKLFDVDGRICIRRRPGPICQRCSAGAPAHNGAPRAYTVVYERDRLLHRFPRLGPPVYEVARAARGSLRRRGMERPSGGAGPLPASAEAYQRRRDVNVERLGKVDALLAMSHRVAELSAALGVSPRRLRTLHLTLAHLDALRPRRLDAPPRTVHFATLNGAHSREKGADVLAAAVQRLADGGVRDGYRLTLFGWVDERVRHPMTRAGPVHLGGTYDTAGLDELLDDVDVGIVPSIWEEAYGYVGLELLAKGIPVIGNARGGIPDYVRPGLSGWLNTSATGEELARIMLDVIQRPEQVLDLHRRVVEHRAELVKPLDLHLGELDAIYEEVIAGRGQR